MILNLDIINKSKNILNLYENNKINEIILDEDKDIIIRLILNTIKNNNILNHKNYKMEHFYNLLDYFINNHIDAFNNKRNKLLLLKKIVKMNKGYILINKIINIIDDMNQYDIYDLLIISSKYGCFQTFLLLLKYYKKKLIVLEINNLLLSSIENSDDRIYKYILNNYNDLDINKKIIEDLIYILGHNKVIPDKIKLKKIKYLSNKINLNNYFFKMISSFNSLYIIKKLHLYYYDNNTNIYTILDINNLLDNINDINDINNLYIIIYNLFKTETEKILYIILCIIKFGYIENIEYNKKVIKDIIINNYDNILYILYYKTNIKYNILFDILDKSNNIPILKILCEKNLITKYFEEKISNSYLFNINLLRFTKFLKYESIKNINNYIFLKYIIKNNYILHHLRIYAKKWKNKKFLLIKNKMLIIHNELLNYKPNINKKILSQGSLNYKLNSQNFYNKDKFINANIIKNNSFNIKSNSIPYFTFPHDEILHNYELDVEYDNINNIYILNDINIPNMLLLDRILLLLNLYNINNILELKIKYNKIYNDNKNRKKIIKWIPNLFIDMNNQNYHMQI